MEGLSRDLRYAWRALARRPLFSALAILILGLGIAGNASIFSVVNTLVLEPLSFKEPDRLVHLLSSLPKSGLPAVAISPLEYLDYKAQTTVFDDIALYSELSETLNLTGDGDPEVLTGWRISANLLPLLGVEPVAGRIFTPAEEGAGSERVALVSDGLWRRRFGTDPHLLGRKILLNAIPYTVIGILPPDFAFPSARVEIWLPFEMDLASAPRRMRRFRAIGRLKPEETFARAETEMAAIARRLAQEHPETNTDFEPHVTTLYQEIFGESFARTWMVAATAVFTLLLIACANVANLLLTRALARERELALRSALGAGRWQILRAFLAEGVVLAALGAVLALALCPWAIALLTSLIPESLPRADEVGLDGPVLAVTLLLAVLTALISGALPAAFFASNRRVAPVLSEGSRGSSGPTGQAVRSALVVVEVALAFALLVAAGLLIRSFGNLRSVDRGIRTENRIAVRFTAPRSEYPEHALLVRFLNDVVDKARALPGVLAAGAVNELPFLGYVDWGFSFTIEGRPAPPPGQEPFARFRIIGPGYFESMGIPLIEGRDFSIHDTPDKGAVIAINETMAERYFPDGSPIGQALLMHGRRREIVAVVGDVRQAGPREPILPAVYYSYTQFDQRPIHTMSLVLRTASDPASIVPALRSAVASIDSDQPLYRIHTLAEAVAEETSQEEALARILAVLVVVALLLAAAGLYGVMASGAAQRTREVGIRMAMGARQIDVLKLVLRRGLALTALGLIVGVAGAVAASRLLAPLLFEVAAFDLRVFAGVTAVLVGVGLLATLLPARTAATVNPVEALRSE